MTQNSKEFVCFRWISISYTILVFEWQFHSEKSLLEEKTVIVDIGESQPCILSLILFSLFLNVFVKLREHSS